jgi:translocation and assembly module TamB
VLMASYGNGAPDGFKGQTEFHATLKGPLKDKNKIEAHLTIPTLTASYQSLELQAAAPIRADYLQSILTIQPAEIRGTGTSLHVQGSVPLAGNSALTLTAQGSIDARVLRIVSPGLRSSGTASLDIRAMGTAASPEIKGQVQLKKIAVATANSPVGVDQLNGVIDLSSDRIQISNMTAEVGG